MRQWLDRTVEANHPVDADRARQAAGDAERRDDAGIGQDAGRHRFEETDAAHAAVAAVPVAGAARPLAD